ncbi:MAG: hypothetical protein KIG60_01125 [Caryophanon sp.]|nr:hypothetical protein [Caryophanon sp.]
MTRFIVTGKIKNAIEENQGLSTTISYRVISVYPNETFLIEDSVPFASQTSIPLIKFYPEQQEDFIALLKLTGDLSTAFYPLIEYIEDYLNNH